MSVIDQLETPSHSLAPGMPSAAAHARAESRRAAELLQSLISIRSISGNEAALVDFLSTWAVDHGLVIDRWQADEAELEKRFELPLRHLPLAGRPTLVIRLPRNPRVSNGRSVIFNAHADVVSAPHAEQWTRDPWAGETVDGRVVGRGACDVKGPLVSAMLMLLNLRAAHPDGLNGDVLLEIIPGEEDCVGLGTMTSIARGYTADACIVVEPTDGQPRSASRGGVRFQIVCTGRAVHGTVKWLGRDAIALSRNVLDALDQLESTWNDRAADEGFSSYPIARPITVDRIHGGEWQGMTCDRCVIEGYVELLPDDSIDEWCGKLTSELKRRVSDDIAVEFSEKYVGHRTGGESDLCRVASALLNEPAAMKWQAFNSGCEAGTRASLLGTPTLVWGPGSLNEAHAIDESIAIDDVLDAAGLFERFVKDWCGASE